MFKLISDSLSKLFTKEVVSETTITKTYFQKYLENNREHQTEALSKMISNDRGIICIPCGTGKTRIQASYIVQSMLENVENNTHGIFVIASHRLALNNQLCDSIVDLAINCNFEFDVILLHSDRADEDAFYGKYYQNNVNKNTHRFNSTTQEIELKKYILDSEKDNRNVLIVATYKSFDKLSVIQNIDLVTCDEAHNLIGSTDEKENMANFLKVNENIKKCFFFTATPKTISEYHGMNNVERFGNFLIKVSPKEMIERREIVAPKFQIIDIVGEDRGGYDNNIMTVKSIIESFTFHKEKIKLDSKNPNMIGAKLLITCSGNTQLTGIIENEDFISYCKEKCIKAMSFSSTNGYYCDFLQTNRDNLIREMNSLEDSKDSIILHMDILTEGIDLPAITGVLLLRGLGKIKLIQNVGRACRLFGYDRNLVYSGNTNLKDFVKPYCHILLPTFNDNIGDYTEIKDIISEVINEYEIPYEDFNKLEVFTTKINEELLDSVTKDYVEKVSTKVAEIKIHIEDIYVQKAILETTVESTKNLFSNFFKRNKNVED